VFNALQLQVGHKAERARAGIVVETVEPAYTSQQCSKCGCTLEENRADQQCECLDCRYTTNADYNVEKNITRKLSVTLQQGQKSVAGGASCQDALKSGIVTVTASRVVSDTFVSASVGRESTTKPTAAAVGN
jgi:Transposase and inactivated derivatives